jgi:hypothetical protein
MLHQKVKIICYEHQSVRVIIFLFSHHQENKKNYANNPILMSPLKDILPKDMSKRNANKMGNKNEGNSHKELLVAYTDSPLLRHQPIAFKSK